MDTVIPKVGDFFVPKYDCLDVTAGSRYTVIRVFPHNDGDFHFSFIDDAGDERCCLLEGNEDQFIHNVLSHTPDTDAVVSDGGSSAYYHIPEDTTDLQDLIEAKDMSFARANIFKACYRMGEKAGADVLYDINKIIWFAERLKKMVSKGKRV